MNTTEKHLRALLGLSIVMVIVPFLLVIVAAANHGTSNIDGFLAFYAVIGVFAYEAIRSVNKRVSDLERRIAEIESCNRGQKE